jgi:hypothetical protein
VGPFDMQLGCAIENYWLPPEYQNKIPNFHLEASVTINDFRH